jgi:phenylacetate-CoA ligase
MLVIRGNNVFPSAIESLVRRVPEIGEFRLSVAGEGALADLLIEIEPAAAPGQDEAAVGQAAAVRLTTLIRDELHFRPEVRVVAAGTLPRFEFKAKRVNRGS